MQRYRVNCLCRDSCSRFIAKTKIIYVSFVLPSELCDKAINIIQLQYCIYQFKLDISPALSPASLAFDGIILLQNLLIVFTGLLGEAVNGRLDL